jgi:hypothetical protein
MLFVAFRPQFDKPSVPVFINRIYTEHFNNKSPMEPLFSTYSSDFLDYNPHSDGIPAPDSMRLPPHLVMVCKGLRRLTSDFYADSIERWVVSEQFYALLKKFKLLSNHYEECKLTVVSTKNQPISDKEYYLIRIFQNDNALVDFDRSPSVPSTIKPRTKSAPLTLYYPELIFHSAEAVPPMLYLDQKCFRYGFLCNQEVKHEMEQRDFSGFDFYGLKEFVQEQLYREKHPDGPPSNGAKRLA